MTRRRDRLGAACSMRNTLASFLFAAFLTGFISIWQIHSNYLGRNNGSDSWGTSNIDASLAGAWLPEPPSTSIRGGRKKGGRNHAGRRKKRKGSPTKKQSSIAESSVTKVIPELNRVYCMVPFIWTPSALHAYHAIQASWGKRCNILRFFIDPVIGDEEIGFYNMTDAAGVIAAEKAGLILPDDVVILHDMKRPWHTCGSQENEENNKPIGNCRNIFEKVWRMIVHVAYGLDGSRDGGEHGSNASGAEWFVKVDSDTFLFPENVGRYVEARKWSYNDQHYFGHVLNHRKDDRGVSIVAGGAVFFSRATLLAGADAFRRMPMDKGNEEEDGTCRDAYTGTEEVVTAICLKEHSNITAEPAIDPEGREQVSLYEVDIMLEYNRTDQGEWWFWQDKQRFPCHDDGDCLASLPLAFHHYKDSQIFLDFEKEFYGSIMKGEDDPKLIRTKNGRVAARHWPHFDQTHRYFERVRAAMKAAGSEIEDGSERQEEKNNLEIAATKKQSTFKQPSNNRRISSMRNKKSTKKELPANTQPTNRVYCMVPFIWTPSAFQVYHAIHASWGKRCHILNFFIDPVIGDEKVGFYNMTEAAGVIAAEKANLALPDDVVILHGMKRPWHASCPNKNRLKEFGNCRNIWEKIWRMMVYVADGSGGASAPGGRRTEEDDTGADMAEWFVKVDSDTFLFPENVGRYVEARKWSHDDQHYFGHVLSHRKDDRGVSTVAGGAVFYSRAALLAGADSFRKMPMDKGNKEEDGTCRDAYTGTEEMVTAICLKEHGISAEPAIDPEGREHVSLYEVDDIIKYNRTDQGEWWFWKNKKRFPCHDDGDCLAYLPLALHHYKDSRDFLDLEKEFYGSVMKGEKDPKLIRTKDGRVAARRWPNFDVTHQYFERVRAAMKAVEYEDSQTLAISNVQQLRQTEQLNNRLYCVVPFIWSSQYIPSYHAIRKTWGKRCDILKFMIDPIIGDDETGYLDLRTQRPVHELPDDLVVIDIQRPWNACADEPDGNCRNIWEKIWRSWIWVDSHGDSDLAEWFVKIDADSFLFPENMKRYVVDKGWSSNEHHYFGHILMHKTDTAEPMIAGAAVFFSRATLKAAANIFRKFENTVESYNGEIKRQSSRVKCKDTLTDQEELITSICLKQHLGVEAYPVLDETGQELVIVGEIEDVLLWNRTGQGEWWYWKNKPKKHPITGKDDVHHCCGELPIAFHGYQDSQWFFKLESEFYSEEVSDEGDSWKKYQWRNPTVTEKYFDRVRRAMKKAASIG